MRGTDIPSQDFACVDQDNPKTGVTALPIIVAQCDAVISLIDDDYFDRAWCCVEAMMIDRLRNRSPMHAWYEHVPVDPSLDEGTDDRWGLIEAPYHDLYPMADKKLSYEQDRPKVLFLARQSVLLGRTY